MVELELDDEIGFVYGLVQYFELVYIIHTWSSVVK